MQEKLLAETNPMCNNRPGLMMTAICLGAFLSHFTAGVVNVSLPALVNVFHSSLDTVQWVTTGYLLIIACLLPIMGRLGDRYDLRLIHNGGYLLFTLTSVLVVFSPNLAVLLTFRVFQAAGAAMFQATNLALITLNFPPEKRGRALGTVSSAVALGGMCGPVAGGMIAEWLNWKWLFLVHVPVAALATWLAHRYIPRIPTGKAAPSGRDPLGALLFMLVIGSATTGISNGSVWGWGTMETWTCFIVFVLSLAVLLPRELRHRHPFLPVRVFRIPAVAIGLATSWASFGMANLVLVVMPFYLIRWEGVSTFASGAMMGAYPLVLAVAGPLAGALSDRYHPQRFLLLGAAGMSSGLALLTLFIGRLPLGWTIVWLACIGLGMGLIASPNNSYIMKHTPPEHVGAIGGLIALSRNTGMAMGAAIGLGMLNLASRNNPAPTPEGFRMAFGTGFLISISALLLLGYGVIKQRIKEAS